MDSQIDWFGNTISVLKDKVRTTHDQTVVVDSYKSKKVCFNNMKVKKALMLLISFFGTIFLLGGCGFPGLADTSSHTIRVASDTSTESQIVGNIIVELIDHETNHKSTILDNLGTGTMPHKALQRDNADIIATSYSGTDLTGILQQPPVKSSRKAEKLVNTQLKQKFDEIRFPTFGFSDTYAFMVTQETAKKYNLNTISDLAKVGPQMQAGVDTSWMDRPGDGYNDFSRFYKFKFKRVFPMQLGLVYNAVAANKMPTVLGYSTDGRILSYNLKVLKDDKHFFPPYDCSLVAMGRTLRQYPELKPLLHRLDGKINVKTMQKLNYEADDKLQEPSVVAENFLKEHNYFR